MDMIARTITTPQATPPMCSAMVLRSNCIALVLLLEWFGSGPFLGQLEVDGHGHDDRHRNAVEQRRRIDPLLDRIDGRLIEQRDPPQDLHVRHLSLGADRALEDDYPLDARLLG